MLAFGGTKSEIRLRQSLQSHQAVHNCRRVVELSLPGLRWIREVTLASRLLGSTPLMVWGLSGPCCAHWPLPGDRPLAPQFTTDCHGKYRAWPKGLRRRHCPFFCALRQFSQSLQLQNVMYVHLLLRYGPLLQKSQNSSILTLWGVKCRRTLHTKRNEVPNGYWYNIDIKLAEPHQVHSRPTADRSVSQLGMV